MSLCKKIKIEISDQDAEALEFMQVKCRGLYNWWVMKLRNGERWNLERAKQSLRESKAYDPGLRCVYGKLLAEVYFRLDNAMQAFFRRLEAGEKPGFPRVKPRHQFFTLCYPAMYLEVQGKTITLPTGGKGRNKHYPNIIAHLIEEVPDSFHEVAVSRDARGNYYCSFVYDDAEQDSVDQEHKPGKRRKKRKHYPMREDGIVAFDLGIKTLTTGVSDQGASTTSAASRGIATTTSNSTRFAPNGTNARRSPAGTCISHGSTSALLRRNATNRKIVCIKPPISSRTDWLKGLW
jgi:putative transposase